MRRNKLMVALAASTPPTQVATKRRNIAQACGLPEDDVIVIDGATSVTLLPPEPDSDLVDTVHRVLEANRNRLRKGQLDQVATDIAYAIQHP